MPICSICDKDAIAFDVIGDQIVHVCQDHRKFSSDAQTDDEACVYCFVESSGLLPKCSHGKL